MVGKSVLASAIIEKCKLKTDFQTAYVYCHDADSTSNTALAILKGLINQLLNQHLQMLPVFHSRRMQNGEPTLRSLTVAKTLLDDICASIPKLYLIIDGLD